MIRLDGTFAALRQQTRKNYVSYHLIPVYMQPELLKTLSPRLTKRMQGKSCFNFTTVDADEAKSCRR